MGYHQIYAIVISFTSTSSIIHYPRYSAVSPIFTCISINICLHHTSTYSIILPSFYHSYKILPKCYSYYSLSPIKVPLPSSKHTKKLRKTHLLSSRSCSQQETWGFPWFSMVFHIFLYVTPVFFIDMFNGWKPASRYNILDRPMSAMSNRDILSFWMVFSRLIYVIPCYIPIFHHFTTV